MLCVWVYLDILVSMSHDSHSHTNPDNCCSTIPVILSAKQPGILCSAYLTQSLTPFPHFFRLLTALSAITGVSLFYHMHPWFLTTEGTKKAAFFSPQLKSGRCWLSFGFQGLPFQFQPSPACFPPSHPPPEHGIGEEPRQENQRGPSDLTDRSLADVCSFVDIFQQAHWASTARPHLTSLKPSHSEEYADLTFIHLYRLFIYRSL